MATRLLLFAVETVNLDVFVEELRRYAGKPLQDPKVEIAVLVLPTLQEISSQKEESFFPVKLFTDVNKGVNILIRRVDLYVVAMRPDFDGEPWLIFRDTDGLINQTRKFLMSHYPIRNGDDDVVDPKISWLGLSYKQLQSNSRSRAMIELGKDALKVAVESLGKQVGNRNHKSFAVPLTVVIQSISEASRFKSVLDFIMFHYLRGKSPGQDLVCHQLNWGNLSEYLHKVAFDKKPNRPVKFEGHDVSTSDALRIVAVIKGFKGEEAVIKGFKGEEDIICETSQAGGSKRNKKKK